MSSPPPPTIPCPIPPDLPGQAYLSTLTNTLHRALNSDLTAVYLFGSAAYGTYEPGLSDLDIQAVIQQPRSKDLYLHLASQVSHSVLPCPARKLEFVLYSAEAVQTATRHPRFEMNFNTGAAMTDHLTLDPDDEAGHWFLLDIAAGRQRGLSLFGPAAAEVFAEPRRAWICDALLESLVWHREHAADSADGLLNACRGWRFVASGEWGFKGEGAAWALQQDGTFRIVHDAQRARRGGIALGREEVLAFLRVVEDQMGVSRPMSG